MLFLIIVFFWVLMLPALLIQHLYLPDSKLIEVNLPVNIAVAVLGIGILYSRNLAWMVLIIGSYCNIIASFFTPLSIKPLESVKNHLGHGVNIDEAYNMVISLVILVPITIYFMKRRHEMPLI